MLLFALVSCSDSEPPFDSSITWEKVTMPTYDLIDDICFTPTGSVLASVRGNLYRKSGGSSWQKVYDGSGSISLNVFSNGSIYINLGYRSTDDGQTWHSSELEAFNANVQLDNGTIYIGLNNGIIFSTDNGQTWLTDSLFIGYSIPSIVRDRNGNLFAAGNYYSAKIWKMSAGVWTEISIPQSITGGIFDIDVDSTDHLFLTAYVSESQPRVLYRSANAGMTWTQISAPPNDPISYLTVLSNNQLMLSTEKALWRSSDEGMTWTRSDAGIARPGITTMAIGPGNELYCGGYGFYHSTDNGSSWQFEILENTADPISALAGNDVLYAGGELLYRSDDDGATWRPLKVNNLNPIRKISFGEPGEIIVSDAPNNRFYPNQNLFRSTDNGDTWQNIYNGYFDDFVINVQGHIFVSDLRDRPINILRSTDHGIHWEKITAGLPNQDVMNSNVLALHPDGLPYLLFNFRLYKLGSNNIWTRVPAPATDYTFLGLSVSPSGVIISGYYCDFFRSKDEGNHWSKINSTVCRNLFWNDETLFAAGYQNNDAPGAGIMVSTDYGSHWFQALDGLSNYRIRCIGFLNNDHIFAAGDSILYRSQQVFQGVHQ